MKDTTILVVEDDADLAMLTARQLQSRKEQIKKEFFEKITINREVVVQEAGFFSTLYYIGVMEKEVLGRTKPINF